jgi:hypothetical protein
VLSKSLIYIFEQSLLSLYFCSRTAKRIVRKGLSLLSLISKFRLFIIEFDLEIFVDFKLTQDTSKVFLGIFCYLLFAVLCRLTNR